MDSNIIVPQNKDLSIDSTKNISKGKTSRELDLIDQINAEASKAPEKKLTNRAILVNALESTAQTDAELKRLNEYKAKVEEAEALEEHLAEVNKKINEITFTKGSDRFLLPSLKEDNKMLLRLESTQSLKSLLEREKRAAYQQAAQMRRERISNIREQRKSKSTRDLLFLRYIY